MLVIGGIHPTTEVVGFLPHYYKETHHRPPFHKEVGQNFNTIFSTPMYIQLDDETDLGDISEENVSKWLINDIGNSIVDKRQQTPYDARKQLADIIEYNITESEAFDGISVCRQSTKKYNIGKTRKIKIKNIDFDVATRNEVSNWLTNPRKEYISVVSKEDKRLYGSTDTYVLEPVPLRREIRPTRKNRVRHKPDDEHARMALSLANYCGYNLVESRIQQY